MADYTLDDVQKMGTPQAKEYSLDDVNSMLSKNSLGAKSLAKATSDLAPLGDLLKGIPSGFADLGNTLINAAVNGGEAIKNKFIDPKTSAIKQWNDERNSSLQDFNSDSPSASFGLGRLAGNVAATWPVGGVIGRGVKALSSVPAVQALGNSIASGGMRTGATPVGALQQVGNAAARVAGGATNGYASTALVSPEDAGTGALIGGALPIGTQIIGGTGRAIGKSITGGGMSPEVRELAEKAKALGINIPADRLVNSRPLNAIAASLNYVPMSGRAATEDAMNSQLNKALSNTFGQDSSNVTQALRKAQSELGDKFDQVLKSNKVNVDGQLFQELGDVSEQASKELGPDAYRPIANQIDQIAEKGGSGQIDGQAAYNIKRTLDRLSSRNSPEAWHALQLKKSLMGALDRSLGTDEAANFAQLRKQYGSMLDLQGLAKNGAEGEISIARLANMKNINNPEMQDLADIAAQFVKPREGAHGAAQRVSLGALAGALGGWAGGPVGATISAGGMMGAGRATNALLNSDAMRNFLLRSPKEGVLSEPGILNLLTQGAYRGAPFLGTRQGQ